MIRRLVLMAAMLALRSVAAPIVIEQRSGGNWPTANHYRFRHASTIPAREPVLVVADLPSAFSPDSLRIIAAGSTAIVPAKVEFRNPSARVSWLSTGASEYFIYFDHGKAGETKRGPELAMVGTGDRITYGVPGVRGKLAIGLWAYPAALDFDGDGAIDIIVADRKSTRLNSSHG